MHFDLSCWIDRQRKIESLAKLTPKVIQPSETLPELILQRLPGNRGRTTQNMQAVSEPAIHVERQRVIGNLAHGPLLNGHGMPLELVEEHLRQGGGLDKLAVHLAAIVLDEH